MSEYRVNVRLELVNNDTGRLLTYDTWDHYYQAAQSNGSTGPYDDISNAIESVVRALDTSTEESKR